MAENEEDPYENEVEENPKRRAEDSEELNKSEHQPEGNESTKDDNQKEGEEETVNPLKIFVGGVNWSTTEDGLRMYFKKFGEVLDVTLMKDKYTGQPRGFGFIEFANQEAINKATKDSHHNIDGKQVEVKPAFKKMPQGTRTKPKHMTLPRPAPAPTETDENEAIKLFVGGISGETTEKDMMEYFQEFGKVKSVAVMYDHATQRSRGFGFVTYESAEAADIACKEKDHVIKGKNVEVKRYQARQRGGAGRGAPRGGRGGGPPGGYGTYGRGSYYNQGSGGYYSGGYGGGSYYGGGGYGGYGGYPPPSGYGGGYGGYGYGGYGYGGYGGGGGGYGRGGYGQGDSGRGGYYGQQGQTPPREGGYAPSGTPETEGGPPEVGPNGPNGGADYYGGNRDYYGATGQRGGRDARRGQQSRYRPY